MYSTQKDSSYHRILINQFANDITEVTDLPSQSDILRSLLQYPYTEDIIIWTINVYI